MSIDDAESVLLHLQGGSSPRLSWHDDADAWPRWIEGGIGLWEMRVFELSYLAGPSRYRLHWERMQTDHGMYGEGEQVLDRGQVIDYLTRDHMTLSRPPKGGRVSWLA